MYMDKYNLLGNSKGFKSHLNIDFLEIITRECSLPGGKVRSETISNRKSVIKLDDPENFSCLFAVRTEINSF